jgi:hypothetical protein
MNKATVIQGDAADEATISGLCKRALQEEGRLDVFFANVLSSVHIYCLMLTVNVGRSC